MNHTQSVAVFDDGACWLEYDATATEPENAALSKALAAEGKRRLKAGRSDVATIRLRAEFDIDVIGVTRDCEVSA